MAAGVSIAKKSGVEFVLFNFTDLVGVQRSKLVPVSAVEQMAETGAGFAGFAAHLDLRPADSDLFAIPDFNSFVQLPWKPQVGWVACDLHMNGEELKQAPRNALKALLAKASEEKMSFLSGVEPEYFLISEDGISLADDKDNSSKPCYDQDALMRQYHIISEISSSMESLGWGPYQNDHEDANGQFEMNWGPSDPLTTADRHAFFKFMVKSIAEKHGVKATFMPKPFANLTGNGGHIHMSLWDAPGKNCLSLDEAHDDGISQLALNAIGGILASANALSAFTNPSVNSYKRLNAEMTTSGATWSPAHISHGGNDRTTMIRIPDSGRWELRAPDGAANPYLLQASAFAAALYGIQNKISPGARLEKGESRGDADGCLPQYLDQAIDALQADSGFTKLLEPEMVAAFIKIKRLEWRRSMESVSEWELDEYLNI